MDKILIIHGPNLNMLGTREPEIYGSLTLKQIEARLAQKAELLGFSVESRQSNVEGEIINWIHETVGSFQGIIINPGAYTHYSYAIADALKAVDTPAIEVHLSNVFAREAFRKESVIGPVVKGTISGLGLDSYLLALQAMVSILGNKDI